VIEEDDDEFKFDSQEHQQRRETFRKLSSLNRIVHQNTFEARVKHAVRVDLARDNNS